MPGVLALVSFRVFPPQMGGQKGVAVFYSYLKKQLPVVMAVSADNELADETVRPLLYANRQIFLNLFRLGALKKLIKEQEIELLVAEHSYTGWIAWLLHRSTGKPFIIHSHNIEAERFRQMNRPWWKLYRSYERWIHRKAQHNFFISKEDREKALDLFGLDPDRCSVVTYGVDPPVMYNREKLYQELGLDEKYTYLLFNGTLDYRPNEEAVELLIEKVYPVLQQEGQSWKIIITGSRASDSLISRLKEHPGFLYKGFVPDIAPWYQAVRLFLNPVLNDSGIKTKLVEAIANGCTSVSSYSGAQGMQKEVCGDKLVIVPDNDWTGFARAILDHVSDKTATPSGFYEAYSWENITQSAAKTIKELTRQ
jgi:glycosyltransferase involved in cell wall biosynthesis